MRVVSIFGPNFEKIPAQKQPLISRQVAARKGKTKRREEMCNGLTLIPVPVVWGVQHHNPPYVQCPQHPQAHVQD